MKFPNLFIAGAPKCGTSALAAYLDDHPQVYMCPEKEPHYFADDFPSLRQATDLDEYLAMFAEVNEGHVAVGEASVNYLFSKTALSNIHKFNPDSRIIVLLRNPVDQAYSQHSQLLFGLYEDEPDFETAWALQETRVAGNRIPSTCTCPEVLQYYEMAAYSGQLVRLFDTFPKDQVLIFLTDDLAKDPGLVYRRSLELMGIQPDGRTHFPRVNENKVARSGVLARFTERPPEAWRKGAGWIRRIAGIKRIGVLQRLRDMNKQIIQRQPLRPEFRAELVDVFAPEVEKLEHILGRDLRMWTNTETKATAH